MRAGWASLLAIVVLQTGCAAYRPAHKVPDPSTLGNVWVTASSRQPRIDMAGMDGLDTPGKRAGKAAADTAGVCLRIGTLCHAQGEMGALFCAPFIIAGTACLLVGPPVAALVGAGSAPTSNDILAYMQNNFSVSYDARGIQEALRDRVAEVASAYGRDLSIYSPTGAQDLIVNYHPLSEKGVDTILEVEITNIDLKGSGADSPLTLTMVAQSRLIRTKDNAQLGYVRDVYTGKSLTFSEWSENRGEQLVRGLNEGYDSLGTNIHDRIFLPPK